MSGRHPTVVTAAVPRRRAVRWVIGLVAVLSAAGLGFAVLGTRSHPARAIDQTRGVAGMATVQRRDLVQTDTEAGTLSYADPVSVYDRLTGTITWLPPAGRLITRGRALFEVNDEPVILLYGSKPAYRDLRASDGRGVDISELNANLLALGHHVMADDRWQTATTDAVKALQKSLGEKQTGTLALGQIVFLPGAQLSDTVDGTVGSPATSGGAILQMSSTRLVVTVDLAAGSQSEAVVGSRVTIEMPNGSTAGGTITAVSPVAVGAGSSGASSGADSGRAATVPVTITLDRRVSGAGFDQAPVSVAFARARADHVLSVPVTALVATSGARYAVQGASVPHRLTPVSTGLFAAGYVQISGPGIRPGLRVTDSEG